MSSGNILASRVIAPGASWTKSISFSFAQGALPSYYDITMNPNAPVFTYRPERGSNNVRTYQDSFVSQGLSDSNRAIVRDALSTEIASFSRDC